MASSVFVSHSSKDRKIAVRLCNGMERGGLACWISSRDVGPGENYQESIVRAIGAARVMVLVFSQNANNSDEIKKEIALASQHKLVVIPVRVEDVLPSAAFAYELATRQWINMFDNWDQAVERLILQIKTILAVPAAYPPSQAHNAAAEASSIGEFRRSPHIRSGRSNTSKGLIGALAGAACLAIGAGVVFYVQQPPIAGKLALSGGNGQTAADAPSAAPAPVPAKDPSGPAVKTPTPVAAPDPSVPSPQPLPTPAPAPAPIVAEKPAPVAAPDPPAAKPAPVPDPGPGPVSPIVAERPAPVAAPDLPAPKSSPAPAPDPLPVLPVVAEKPAPVAAPDPPAASPLPAPAPAPVPPVVAEKPKPVAALDPPIPSPVIPLPTPASAPPIVGEKPAPIPEPPAAVPASPPPVVPQPVAGLQAPIPVPPRPPPPLIALAPPALAAVGDAGQVFQECEVCAQMVVVPGGTAIIGSPANEPGRRPDEGPQQQVRSSPFAVGRYDVSFAEWDACVAEGGCNNWRPGDYSFGRGEQPVIFVSWNDARNYVSWLANKTGQPYRLLSEAEFEYVARACRDPACRSRPFWFGEKITPEVANYNSQYSYAGSPKASFRRRTLAVEAAPANPFGVYHIVGNVRQWVADCWNPNLQGLPADGRARMTGDCNSHVVRGGAWSDEPVELRASARSWDDAKTRSPQIGLRVARDLIR